MLHGHCTIGRSVVCRIDKKNIAVFSKVIDRWMDGLMMERRGSMAGGMHCHCQTFLKFDDELEDTHRHSQTFI